MKKTKLIALTMVIAIMMIGAGYAAWTDSTNVDATIRTGNMDVNVIVTQKRTLNGTTDYITPVKNIVDNTVRFEVNKLYPTVFDYNKPETTYGDFEIRVKNEGSIPVKLGSVEITKVNPDAKVWKDLRVNAHVSFNNTLIYNNGHNAFNGTLDSFISDLNNMASGKVLEPGQEMHFGSIKYYIDSNTTNETQGNNIGFTIKFNWEQNNLQ